MTLVSLEDFSNTTGLESQPPEQFGNSTALESDTEKTEHQASFEAGYQLGWNDAIKQANVDALNVSDELGRNLKDIGFTYEEARSDILRCVDQLFEVLLDKLFPDLFPNSIVANVSKQLSQISDRISKPPFELHLNETELSAVEKLLKDFELSIVKEPALAPGQAILKLAKEDHLIDIHKVTNEIRATFGS